MPALLLGPMLRYLDATSATIWMQTDAPTQVEVLGRRARTFAVAGRHYALVVLEDLPPEPTAYDVTLDGEHVWPLPGADPSLICPPVTDRLYSLAFGSCRVAAPLEDEQAGTDALHALAERVRASSPAMRPDVLLLVGDQVYADDNISPQTKAFVESRRPATGGESPNDGDGTLDERPLEVCDVDEYVHLYIESWSPAEIRWLFSTLPSMMIFDDHDIRDDWNTSQTWRQAIQQTPWWQERIVSGLVTYWVYQHLGNLSPAELAEDETWQRVQQAAAQGQDAEGLLREMATRADAAADGGPGLRWSYCRDVGRSRIVVLDSRCNRKVDDAQRLMVGDREWEWFREHATGDVDHLLIATSVPFLLPPGVHELEAWDEALCRGRWGERGARLGERLRQGIDLEHWPAFGDSFARMCEVIADVGSGQRGRAPATITFLSGDVHFAYVAEAAFRGRDDVTSRIVQAVCSPLRNPLPPSARIGERFASTAVGRQIGRLLAGTARASSSDLSWKVTRGPAFGNELATVHLDGSELDLTVESAVAPAAFEHRFRALYQPRLAPSR